MEPPKGLKSMSFTFPSLETYTSIVSAQHTTAGMGYVLHSQPVTAETLHSQPVMAEAGHCEVSHVSFGRSAGSEVRGNLTIRLREPSANVLAEEP